MRTARARRRSQFDIDEETIPGGLGPENVAVLRYADGAWTTENVGHDVEGDTPRW